MVFQVSFKKIDFLPKILSQDWTCYLYLLIFSGAFPLSELNLMTDDERELLLPVARNFVSVLEKDTVSQDEIEELAEQTKILNDLIPEQFKEIITSIIDKELNGVGGSVIEA